MTPDQIRLVQSSFALVKPAARAAADAFYRRLFELDPSLRGLFHGDMVHQGERLMQMIGAAVGLLERPETLFPVLHALGARHVGYGVLPRHYDTVGTALVRTLGDLLGEDFSAAHLAAWAAMFAIVKREMLYADAPLSMAA